MAVDGITEKGIGTLEQGGQEEASGREAVQLHRQVQNLWFENDPTFSGGHVHILDTVPGLDQKRHLGTLVLSGNLEF